MTRFLAYTSPARGHLYPITETLLELRRRGHEVAVRTLASEVSLMGRLGVDAAPIAAAIEALPHDDYKAPTPVGALKRAMRTLARRAEHEIPDLERAIGEVQPDALLVDINCQGGATLAEASERPWAHWSPYLMPLPSRDAPPFGLGIHPARGVVGRARDALLRPALLGPLQEAARQINPLRERLGLAPLRRGTDLWARAPLHLYLTAEPFEYPRSDWPSSVQLVGPGTWEPPSEPPAWLEEVERPLVLVTCSTEFQDDGKLARVALEALSGRDFELVVTTAAVDPARLASRRSARVVRFLPHGPLLRRAACVVCHGGMGITQKALAAGVPVCAVPFGRDQLEVAGHLTWCDAGTRLSPGRLRPPRLLAAVREAISKQAAARRVATAFSAAGRAPAAADALEALAAGGGASVSRTGSPPDTVSSRR